MIAAASGPKSETVGTNIYKNGLLVTAVPGVPLAWLDNNTLLVKNYTTQAGTQFGYIYTSSAIYDSSGSKLSTLSLPELTSVQPIGGNQIYSPDQNSIYSLTTGAITWSGGAGPIGGVGAVAGQTVVFVKGTEIVLDTY